MKKIDTVKATANRAKEGVNARLLRYSKFDYLTPRLRRELSTLGKIYRNRLVYIDKLLEKPVKKGATDD